MHRQRQEDILLKVLPVLSDGLAIQDVPELTLACYTLSIILASNGDLADHVVDSVMDKIVGTLSTETYKSGLVCLAVLFQHRTKSSLPKKTVSTLTRLPNLSVTLRQLSDNYELDSFVLALIRVSLQSLRKKDRNTKVAFAETLVRSQVLAAPALDAALTSVLATIQELEQRDAVTVAVRTQLLDMIQRLAASEEFGAAVTRSMAKSGLDLGTLELTLQMVFADTTEINGASDVEMDNIEDWETSTKSLDNIFAHVPQRTVDEYSFLAPSPSRLFDSLETAFLSACHHEGVIEKFQELSIWRPTSNSTEPLFISFLLRIIHRPYPLLPRLVAIKILMLNIERQKSNFDAQALLPYITSLLADPSQSIRREAANLLMAVEKVMPLDLVDGEIRGRWGSSGLYGSGRHTAGLTWLSSSDVKKIIKQAFLPFLEECVLDSAQISRAIHHAVKGEPLGSRVSAKTDSIDLKKSLRHGLFGLLLSHLSETPLYSLKLSLLIIVSPIDKVGQISRGKELLPMIEAWASLSSEDAQSLATAERIDVSGLDNAMVSAISPNDKDAVLVLLSLLKGQASHRQTFATAVFNRISQFWPALRSDRQIAASEILFDLLLRRAETGTLAHYAQEVLLSVPLSTDALVTLFEKTQASMTKMREHSPANKRRRTSQNQMVPNSLNSPGEMELNMAITTFVLELVDSSKPENRPQLLGPLFQLLAFLHYLKARTRSELPYLLSLNLASILAIVDKAKTSSKPDFETSLIRTELIIDCVRMTENPQVQKVALLLIASLCKIVPDRVLHNIMPIFTFMSTGILRLDDEHSTHVIDQTIDLVIPPLIQSLHAQRRDVIQGTSELLLSFIAAFDHIPSHRRLRLFEKLISKLGATEFLFAILGMLASKDATEDDMDGFLAMLMNSFDVDTQLSTFSQYIDILFDALQPQPGRAKLVLNLSGNDADEEHRKVLSSVETLAFLLRRTVLKTAVRDALKPSRASASNVHDHLSVLLEKILSLTNQTRADKELVLAVTDCLTALLELPSLAGYMDVVKICLASHDSELRCRVLRLLEIRLQETRSKDNATQRAAIAFIPTLADIIKIDSNSLVKHAAVASIDRICEKYGRSDITTVIESARVVAGDQCLGGEDRHLKVIAILSLASTVEILKEAIIPVLPDLMPRAFRLLEESMEESQEDADQHNAVFSLLSALLSHVPFMVTEAYLDEILALSAESAHSDIGEDGDQSRREALQLVARRIDLKILVPALQRKWSVSVECSMTAVKESLETLGTAIERHSKSSVVKNADLLSDFLLQAFDFRRIQLTNRTEDGYSDSEVIEIESAVNAVALKMIYKLNDAVFRPIFARVVDWAVKCPGIQREGIAPAQMLRQTTLFAFLTHFFVTLKSIVTSYASYILEPAVQVLSHTPPSPKPNLPTHPCERQCPSTISTSGSPPSPPSVKSSFTTPTRSSPPTFPTSPLYPRD